MSEFAKKANALVDSWRAKLEDQTKRMDAIAPSAKQIATEKALETLNKLKENSFNLGYNLRSQAQRPGNYELLNDLQRIGMPGREVMIELPATKEANIVADTALRHARTAGEDYVVKLKEFLDNRLQRGTNSTTDPTTLPWYMPAATMTAPSAFIHGYHGADTDFNKQLNSQLDTKIDEARKQFEDALQTEYDSRAYKRASCASEFISNLANFHVKVADGELNQILGAYGSLASVLAAAGYAGGRKWVESNDPRQQRLKALKEHIYKRMQNKPLPVLVASGKLPEDQNVEFKVNMSEPAQGELVE